MIIVARTILAASQSLSNLRQAIATQPIPERPLSAHLSRAIYWATNRVSVVARRV